MYALKPTAQEQIWNQAEFELVDPDGTIARWKWVEKPEPGKKTWQLKCSLGERLFQLVEVIKPKPQTKPKHNLKVVQPEPEPPQVEEDLFVNLHGHTEYSDGLMTVEEYIDAVSVLGQPAMAVTDHNTMGAIIAFLMACKKKGKKGIAGNELYLKVPEVTKYLKHIRNINGNNELQGDYKVKERFHQLAIALNATGYRNLNQLTTLGNENKSVTFDQLQKYQEGIIVTSGCVAGVMPQLILLGEDHLAYDWAKRYQKTWGDRFYIELQDHQQPMYVKLNQTLVKIAFELGIECIITADSHYLTAEDYTSHSIFQAVKWNKTLSDSSGLAYDRDLFVPSSSQLKERFSYLRADVVEKAIANTCKIASRVTDDYYGIFRPPAAPKYPIPSKHKDNNEYLATLSLESLKRRFQGEIGAEYSDRLSFELKTIAGMGFSDYFLVIWDLVKFARDNNIPVGPGRGSAAGSLVCYALGITNIDPVHHGLLFERFLNPERVNLPDVDLDFCPERRKEIINYLIQRYGETHVAQLSTPSTMKAKSLLQDVGRTMDIPPKERGQLTALIPDARGKTTGLKDMLYKPLEEFKGNDRHQVEEFRNLYQTNPIISNWVNAAIPLEGKRKTTGVHPAAVIISDVPLLDLVSLRRGEDGVLVTECAMNEIEAVGPIKADILGISNLTLLQIAVDLVKKDFGIESAPDAIAWHDPKILELFARGDTDGIFQFESDGMKQLLMRLLPSGFEDIVAANALYRPGPLDSGQVDLFIAGKHGGDISYPSPAVKRFLESTYGQAIYQEQLMKLAQEIAGFTLGQADLLRRACGKKKAAEMAKYEHVFTEGCLRQGHSETLAAQLWKIIYNSAEYCFNRSHSLAYSRLAWQCAYFKVYYPVQFMAALLSVNAGKPDKLTKYLTIACQMKIKILPPDINKSGSEFKTIKGKDILYGLKGIDGLGEVAIASIINARDSQPFTSLADFAFRVGLSLASTESLVKVGAFDRLVPNRASAIASLPNILKWASEKREANKKQREDQLTLFAFDSVEVPPPKIPQRTEHTHLELLEFEKEILGVYLSGHPLEQLPAGKPFSKLKPKMGNVKVSVHVTASYPKECRNGPMADLELEDQWGDRLKAVCWPEQYLKFSYALDKGSFVHLECRVTEWKERLQLEIHQVVS